MTVFVDAFNLMCLWDMHVERASRWSGLEMEDLATKCINGLNSKCYITYSLPQ